MNSRSWVRSGDAYPPWMHGGIARGIQGRDAGEGQGHRGNAAPLIGIASAPWCAGTDGL
jgi:hypothetical protein